MNYDSPGEIVTQVNNLLLSQTRLMQNRSLINRVMNGEAPMTPEEQQDENVFTNVNFLSGTRICSNATNQINNAFTKSAVYFTVRVDKGPMRLRQAYGSIITKEINRLMKRSRTYKSAKESAHAQVVLHGPGAIGWRNRRSPLPGTLGIEDVLIPSGTTCDMENLDRFALYKELTWPQLHKMAFGPAVDKGWNKSYVRALCDSLQHQGYQPIYQGNRWLFPEKLAEDYKEGAAQTFSSSLPKVLAWDFFFRNEDTGKWNRRLVLDYNNMVPAMEKAGGAKADVIKNQELLYTMDDYAEDWQQVLHWYIGNCSNVAPYRYHSIRSIGYLLYALVMLDNKTRNRMSDYVFTQMLNLLRNVSDDNREKIGLIDLQNFGVVPDGVSFVPAGERYACDPNLMLMQLNQYRQLMSESSSAFLPDLPGDPGASKEMTATETLVRQNTSITLTSAVLNQLGDQSLYEYQEIARRFAMRSNPDPMAKEFRERIEKQGVPLEMLDIDAWEVMPEMAKGGGSKAMELTVSQALMRDAYPLVDSGAQRIILRNHISALTDNPDEALTLVPEVQDMGNVDVQMAQTAFAVLMEGVPYTPRAGADPVVMAQVLMQLTGVALNQAQAALQQPAGLTIAAEKVMGAANVLSFTQQAIAKAGQSELRAGQAKKLAKQWELLSGELQQLGKAVQAAEEQQQPQVDGEQAKLQAKLQDMQATGELNRQLAAASAEQKMKQKQASWAEENARRNATTATDAQRKLLLTHAEVASKDITTRHQLMIQQAQAQADAAESSSE